MQTSRVWIIGPIAWDTVLSIAKFPTSGGFLHAKKREDRPGGQGLNVALGLATAPIQVGLIGYVGDDLNGKELYRIIESSAITFQHIFRKNSPTPHVIILVDKNGERTMIGMEKSYLNEIRIEDSPVRINDIVVWPIWRDEFVDDLKKVQKMGCKTIVGSNAALSSVVKYADILIGSKKEILNGLAIKDLTGRFERIIMTDGENGSIQYSSNTQISQPAIKIEPVDTTGAGDAFLSGIALALRYELSDEDTLSLASLWAGMACETASSIPPAWNAVASRWLPKVL